MSNHKDLFTEFATADKNSWKARILEELKRSDYDSLIWKTEEGYQIQPFYTREDLDEVDYLAQYHNNIVKTEGFNSLRSWENIEKISVTNEKEANKDALNALNKGADGISFDLSPKSDVALNTLLQDIHLNFCSISFTTNLPAMHIAEKYFEYASKQQINNNELRGAFNYDPIVLWTQSGHLPENAFTYIKKLIEISDSALHFYALIVNSSPFNNSGANAVQEIAFTLSSALCYIDQLSNIGLEPAKIIQNIGFSISTGGGYFTEIAKLRALRILYHQLAKAYHVDHYHPGQLKIHSLSSFWNKTSYSAHVNMLRNTTEAMAAIIGGCDSLCIAPHDILTRKTGSYSRRIARNIPTILKEESYFDKVADPAAGSYYIENLTNLMAEHAWELFQQVEKMGGFIEAFKKGYIQQTIKKTREEKLRKTANRKDVVIGVNQYVNREELLGPISISKKEVNENVEMELLTRHRKAEEFEQIRLNTEQFIKQPGNAKKAMVYLAPLSNTTTTKARIAFANDFFNTGGFETLGSPFKNIEETAREAIKSNAQVLVICGSDEEYTELAGLFIERYTEQNGECILMIAGKPDRAPGNLDDYNITYIHMESDVIEVLKEVQSRLEIIER